LIPKYFHKKKLRRFRDYNEKVTDLDPRFTSLKPRHDLVLVRVYLKSFEEVDGIQPTMVDLLKVTTGQDRSLLHGWINNPFPFAEKGVVVAAPEGSDLKTGDKILLKDRPVSIIGDKDNALPVVNNAFIHPEDADKYDSYPVDPSDPNYGYLAISEYEIIFKY
jgi:hypothetical protein